MRFIMEWQMRRLERIQELIDEAHKLMAHEPGLDAVARESMRALKSRVRMALRAAPDVEPPELWKNSEEKREGKPPLDFAKRVYAHELQQGTLTAAAVGKRDKKLGAVLYNCHTPEELRAAGFVTRKMMNDVKLAAAGTLKRPPRRLRYGDMSSAQREEARLWSVTNRRRQRAEKKAVL